jgi:hypothetical protein
VFCVVAIGRMFLAALQKHLLGSTTLTFLFVGYTLSSRVLVGYREPRNICTWRNRTQKDEMNVML